MGALPEVEVHAGGRLLSMMRWWGFVIFALVGSACSDPEGNGARERDASLALVGAGIEGEFSKVEVSYDGEVASVAGYVATEEDQARLFEVVQNLEGTSKVRGEVEIRPRGQAWVLAARLGEHGVLLGEVAHQRGADLARALVGLDLGQLDTRFDGLNDEAWVATGEAFLAQLKELPSAPVGGRGMVAILREGEDPQWEVAARAPGRSLAAVVAGVLGKEKQLSPEVIGALGKVDKLAKLPRGEVVVAVAGNEVRVDGRVREKGVSEELLQLVAQQYSGHEVSGSLVVSNEVRPAPVSGERFGKFPSLPVATLPALVMVGELGSPWEQIVVGRQITEDPRARVAAVVGEKRAVKVIGAFDLALAEWMAVQKRPYPWLAMAAFGGRAILHGEVADERTKELVMSRAEEVLSGFEVEDAVELSDGVRHVEEIAVSLEGFPRASREGGGGTIAAVWLGEKWQRGHPSDPGSLRGHFPRGFEWDDLIAGLDELKAAPALAEGQGDASEAVVVIPKAGVVDEADLVSPWVGLSYGGGRVLLKGEVADQEDRDKIEAKVRGNFEGIEVVSEIKVVVIARKVEGIALTIGTTPRPSAALEGGEIFYSSVRLGFTWVDGGVFPIYYDGDSHGRQTDHGRAVSALKEAMEREPAANFEVVGHTDAVGEALQNLRLSLRRAQRLREYLVEEGVDGTRVTCRGSGEMIPVSDNDSEEGRAQNRRLEIRKRES